MEDMCKLIPDSLSDVDLENTGWHRGCHQRFAMNLNRLQLESQAKLEDAQSSSSCYPRKRRPEEGNELAFPHGICLFGDKKTTTSGGKIFKPTETFTSWGNKKSGCANIEQMARDLQNNRYSTLLRKVARVGLFSAEAHFHQPCYSMIYSKHQTWKGYHRSSNADENVGLEMLAAHAIAYESAKSFIQKEITTNQNVMSLSVFRNHYIHQLEQENRPNPHFRSEKLIKKFEKDESISQLISFSKVSWKGCISFWLVFSSEMSISKAVVHYIWQLQKTN